MTGSLERGAGSYGPKRKRVLVELYLGKVTRLVGDVEVFRSGEGDREEDEFTIIICGADNSGDLYPEVFIRLI